MIYGFSSFGYEGTLVAPEVDLRRGIPAVDFVGLSDRQVRQSRENIRAAIKNSGLEFPPERVLISLSPADVRKDGPGFDFPTALAVAAAQNGLDVKEDVVAVGELYMNGDIRPVRGEFAAVQTAAGRKGIKFALVPENSEVRQEDFKDITVVRAGNLRDAFSRIKEIEAGTYRQEKTASAVQEPGPEFREMPEEGFHLDKIKGNGKFKLAVAAAVAGGHHILAYGPPGCGKTITLQCMPELMTKPSSGEKESIKRIASLAGLYPRSEKDLERPFRQPHQTASIEGMCGGGQTLRPGEITLAHNGVLFLDEAAEFRSSVLQMLRVPLESGNITLNRAGRSTIYPSKFQLAMAANSCPCGNYGSKDKICLCSARAVEQYWKKFSGPLLDRIAIRVRPDREDRTDFTVDALREKISAARKRQMVRQGKLNQDLDPAEVAGLKLTKEAEKFLSDWAEKTDASQREIANMKRLARTVEDMGEGRDEIGISSVKSAFEMHEELPGEVFEKERRREEEREREDDGWGY